MKVNQQAQNRQAKWELREYKKTHNQSSQIASKNVPSLRASSWKNEANALNLSAAETMPQSHLTALPRLSSRKNASLGELTLRVALLTTQLRGQQETSIRPWQPATLTPAQQLKAQKETPLFTSSGALAPASTKTSHASIRYTEEASIPPLETPKEEINLSKKRLCDALKLPLNANDEEIRNNYRQLRKQYHPDRGGDEKKFIWISKLYTDYQEAKQAKKEEMTFNS